MRTIIMTYPLSGDFHREVTRGVIDYSRPFSEVLYAVGWEPSLEELSNMPEVGLIGWASQHALINRAGELGIPYVALGSSHQVPAAPRVLTDEHLLGQLAAEHFAGLGLRQFGYTGHRTWPFVEPRGNAFAQALQVRGLKPPSRFLRMYYSQGRRLPLDRPLQSWLKRLPKPCGVLAATDFIALEVIAAARQAGLRVPDDVAILGVDDDEIASALSSVAISSIPLPAYIYGYEAARLLYERWETGRTDTREVKLPPASVVARASTDLIAVEDQDVAQAIRLIRDHAHESIDVTWVAGQLPVSRRSLERKFKQIVGQTVLERIHQVRFDKVKQMLADTDLPLKVIAQRAGITNAKWLSDSFRKYAGLAPSAYRQQFQPTYHERPGIPKKHRGLGC